MLSSFLIIMLAFTLGLFVVTRLIAEALIRHHHAQKSDFFRAFPIQPGDIVFLGDSLTDGARWDEIFPDLPVKNRGINADTTQGVLQRLGDVLCGSPRALFILIGTNDLPWFTYRSNSDILETYERILQRCRAESPQTQVFVQSLLPRARPFARRIRQLNLALQTLAERNDCVFIDLHPHFADAHGALRRELTNDSLHLMAKGYQIWAEIVRPALQRL